MRASKQLGSLAAYIHFICASNTSSQSAKMADLQADKQLTTNQTINQPTQSNN